MAASTLTANPTPGAAAFQAGSYYDGEVIDTQLASADYVPKSGVARGFIVTTLAGTVKIKTAGGNDLSFTAAVGIFIPIAFTKFYKTGTAATGIVALAWAREVLGFKSDTSGVRRALHQFAVDVVQNSRAAVATAARVAEAAAKQTTEWKDGEETNPDGSPRRHGVHTRDTIEGGSSEYRGWVEAEGAARFLENGTPPHEIPVGRKGYLRFFVNGEGPIYTDKAVHHPGTRATLFMRTAATEAAIFLAYRLRRVVAEAKSRHGLRWAKTF